MNLRRIWTIARADLAHNARRVLFWIWVAILFLFAWALSSGSARIQSGDSSVGGTKAHITSEFAVAQQMTVLAPLVYGFFVAVVAGMVVIQDDDCKIGELLHATPLRPGEYVWGKFLAALVSCLAVLLLHVGAMAFCNHVLPAGDAVEYRGAFHALNYLKPAAWFAVPTIVFMAGFAFMVGDRTRRPILVFFLPVAVLLTCIFFLWEWAPSWLDPRIDRALMLIDPAGFRWLNETWLKVDRGAGFYNTATVPLDGLIVANRLIVVALGLAAVAYSQVRFGASLRGASKSAKTALKAIRAEPMEDPAIAVAKKAQPPLTALGMRTRRPRLLAGAWDVARVELIELRSSPGLYLFVPLLILEALGPNLLAVGAFDTPLLVTSGTFAVRAINPLSILMCLLLLFYTVESMLREQRTELASISSATPVRTGSLLLGKVLANALVAVAVLLAEFLAGVILLVIQGKVALELRPFFLAWGLLLVPSVILWTTFVMAVLAISRNRYTTYAVGLGTLCLTGYGQFTGKNNWVGNWPLWNAVQWSDISILELDRPALWMSRLLALALALFFTVLTVRFYGRREADAVRTIHRLRPASLSISILKLLPLALPAFVCGSVLWGMVDRGYQGESTKRTLKDYWRKNLATYNDWPLPDLTAVALEVDLKPARSRLRVAGSFDLVNHREKPLAQIPLTGGPHWEKVEWTLDGARFKPEDRKGLYVFTPAEPLRPGKSVRIGFGFEGTFPRGISKNGRGTGEFVLPSGVVLTSFQPNFAPVIGFMESVGIDDDNKYESKEYPDDYYKGQTDSAFGSRHPFKSRVRITGPAEFQYNSVGLKTRDEVAGGLRTTVWESDSPVNFLNIVAGRWEVRRGAGTAVYYHSGHGYNIGEMVEALDAARRHYSEWFSPYPWAELKLSEFPALASYAQGFPTDITFSESIGFLTKSDPKANAAFMVTAHESAHQWWGNMIAPGKGPGGNLLSEGTSHFSTLLLFERVKGLHARIEYAKKIEDSYAKGRRADSERPLVKIDGSRDGDTAVTYDKAGMVFWMLLNHMGRENALRGIRVFFDTYRNNPDHPVLQDFLAVMRPFAADAAAFDAFTKQWFFTVVVPEYRLSAVSRASRGGRWSASARVENVGTGTMPVEVAAVKGERFKADGSSDPSYREARRTVILGAHESKPVTIECDFEPERLVVDPDVKVLQLRRKAAVGKF
jgi:ABC-type transport system involved in multi-copper enzyme maturation permease subunit